MREPLQILALVLLAGCGQQQAKTYPPQFELNFMRACEAQRPAQNVCSCTWERIAREIPVDDFMAFERLNPSEQASHPLYTEIQRFALECRAETGPPDEDPPAP